MDTQHLADVAPHYVVMLLLMLAVINVIRMAFGELNLWVEVLILVAVAFAYRPAVQRLGVAPDAWEQRN